MVQQFSLNLQTQFHRDWLLEVAYVGAKGDHLQRSRSLNQAGNASPDDPIRGETSDTLANVAMRVPILGIPANSLFVVESEGSSWYNGLLVSVTKRMSRGFQFLASYTFSKTLDTDGADINSTSSGILSTWGNQNLPPQRWGRASFDRPQRFIFSATWAVPSPQSGILRATLGDWTLGSVVTVQSGNALTIADTNSKMYSELAVTERKSLASATRINLSPLDRSNRNSTTTSISPASQLPR
jgi:hypothetical protein